MAEKRRRKPSRYEKGRVARLCAVQAFYEWGFKAGEVSVDSITRAFVKHRLNSADYPAPADSDLFHALMLSVQTHFTQISHLTGVALDHGESKRDADPVIRAILMVAFGELLSEGRTLPIGVVLSEYVDITKGFFAGREPSFINKSLDQAVHGLNLVQIAPEKQHEDLQKR